MKCVCPMGGDRTCPDDCLLAVWANLPPSDRKTQRKPVAEKLYQQGFTMEQIATQLGVSIQTISTDLSNFQVTGKSKPAKTASNPKGAGRPKGRLQPKRRLNTTPTAETAALSILDEDKSYSEVEKETGLSSTVLRSAVAREEGRRDPGIDRNELSMSAQQKLDAAMRQHKAKLDAGFHKAVNDRVRAFLEETILPKHREEQEQAKRIMNARKGVMDKSTFNAIRRALHPDSRNSISDRVLAAAFDAFMRMEKVLLAEKDSPTEFQPLPRTWADWEKAKQAATAARKARQAGRHAVKVR